MPVVRAELFESHSFENMRELTEAMTTKMTIFFVCGNSFVNVIIDEKQKL